MKKLLAILVAAALLTGLFTIFAGAVEAADVLDFKDPNSTQIGMSLDVILWNGNQVGNRPAADAYLSEDGTLDAVALGGTSIGYHGWVCFKQEVKQFGYMINDKIVFDSSFWFDNEPGLADTIHSWGGDWALGYPQRFTITVPFDGMAGKNYVCAIVELADGTVVKMNDDTPGDNRDTTYTIKFPGGSIINESEYTDSYVLDKSNAQTWTNGNIGDTSVKYFFKVEDDGVKVAIRALGVSANEYMQIDFNPGNKLAEVPGLFLSFVTGDTFKLLQHNHKTGILDDDNASGADISDKIDGQISKISGGYEIVAKLPKALFNVTDVAGAEEYVYGEDDLYFGMFIVSGGQGYTNQSNAPAAWTCDGLGLTEYVLAGQQAPETQPQTQPQTGDVSVAVIAVLAVLAMSAAVVFMKKKAF